MSRIDLYPTKNASPSLAQILTGTAISGDKVAADVFIRNSTPIPVTVGGSIADTVQFFNEISAVPIGAEQTILTYTVPVASTFVLSFAQVESDSVALIKVKQNGTVIAKDRFSIGGSYSSQINFQKGDGLGLKFSAGTVLTVTGYNASASGAAEFSARLVGFIE